MSPWAEIVSIILYCIQQLGIMLGVGSQAILLIADILASRDGTIDPKEEQFLHATKRVIYFSILCIIFSGILITVMHLTADQASTVFQPAFLFKWMLIGVVTVLAIAQMHSTPSGTLLKAVTGGTWFGLFILHILAPVSTWGVLLVLYLVWMVVFVVCWSTIVFVLRQTSSGSSPQLATAAAGGVSARAMPYRPISPPPAPAQKVPEQIVEQVAVEPLMVKPDLPLPPSSEVKSALAVPALPPPPQAPALSIPQSGEQFPYTATGSAPMLHPHLTNTTLSGDVAQGAGTLANAQVTETLPAVRIMPKTQSDLDTQHRGPLVKFG